MKLGEILDQVDTSVPNSLPASMKVTWINQIQNQLFRDYPLPDKVNTFSITQGQAEYALPADCPEDRVQHLVIGDKEYEFQPWVEPAGDRFDGYDRCWTAVAGQMVIYPVPKETQEATLYYRPRPAQLVETDVTVEPSFPSDFHELLMFGCAARTARANPQTIALAPMYENDFRQLAEKADLVLVRTRQRRVLLTRNWV